MRDGGGLDKLIPGFNPRPTVRPGDAGVRLLSSVARMFQSTPDREAGRCGWSGGPAHDDVVVSIHARP